VVKITTTNGNNREMTTKAVDPLREVEKTGRRGRPRLVVTKRDLVQIEEFASIGMSRTQIAKLIGVSRMQLFRWMERPDVMDAIEQGQARALHSIGKRLYEKAIEGDLTAIIWFEKTRGKRSDRVSVVHEDEAAAIQQQLSGLSTAQLERIANGESPSEVLGADA
jgi:hypothetical protein